jgi:ribose 5-phosphate isomerase RpiB
MAYLITDTELYAIVPLQSTGEDKVKKIKAGKDKAHVMLKAVLCDDLYNEMIAAYNGGTPTAAEAALFPYCENYLAWLTYKFYLGFANFTDTDNGIRVFTENTSIEAKPYDLRQLQDNAQDFVDTYKSELDYFLTQNVTDYPSFEASTCNTCNKKSMSLGITGAGKASYRPSSYRR